jgi:CheY-like chemotaxis protein
MGLKTGGTCLADSSDTMTVEPPGSRSGQMMNAKVPVREMNGHFAVQGALAETWFDWEPAVPLAPTVPVGRCGWEPGRKTITILLVEDDTIDVVAIRRSFWQLKIPNPIVVARNGLEALDMLRGDNGQEKLEAPYLVLLDLNMPRMGGIEFLEELRRDPALRRTLVFVMTTSAASEDRDCAYGQNIVGYIVKPAAGQGFTDAITALESYWRAIEFPD